MEHPHKFLLYYIEYLKKSGMQVQDSATKNLAQHAWAYLNDSMRLDLCVRHDTNNVACAAILIASRHEDVKIALPSPEWLEVLGADEAKVHSICDEVLRLYKVTLPSWVDPLNEESYLRSARQKLFDEMEEESDPVARAKLTEKMKSSSVSHRLGHLTTLTTTNLTRPPASSSSSSSSSSSCCLVRL